MALQLQIPFWNYISCGSKVLWWGGVNNRVDTFGIVQFWGFNFKRKKSYPKRESESEGPALMVIHIAWCWQSKLRMAKCFWFGCSWRYSVLNYLSVKIMIWSFLFGVQCLVGFYIFRGKYKSWKEVFRVERYLPAYVYGNCWAEVVKNFSSPAPSSSSPAEDSKFKSYQCDTVYAQSCCVSGGSNCEWDIESVYFLPFYRIIS